MAQRLLKELNLPSVRQLGQFALGSSLLFSQGPALEDPARCADVPLSCHNTSVVEDLCCINAPGGIFLLTQFWDANPAIGPEDSWTIHGLWPDHCDGRTYDQRCDASRFYGNMSAILEKSKDGDKLVSWMHKYWKANNGNDEALWRHEWEKHGTCINTLKPECYENYTLYKDVYDYFSLTIQLFIFTDFYWWLGESGIYPDEEITYSLAAFQHALTRYAPGAVTLRCRGDELTEAWLAFYTKGGQRDIQRILSNPDSPPAPPSNCPSHGIRYLPKKRHARPSSTTHASQTATKTRKQPPASSSLTDFQGQGHLIVYREGEEKGCIDDYGVWETPSWFSNKHCAKVNGTTYANGSLGLFVNEGLCGFKDGIFECWNGTKDSGEFGHKGDRLTMNGSTAFYAKYDIPMPFTHIYTAPQAFELEIAWDPVPWPLEA